MAREYMDFPIITKSTDQIRREILELIRKAEEADRIKRMLKTEVVTEEHINEPQGSVEPSGLGRSLHQPTEDLTIKVEELSLTKVCEEKFPPPETLPVSSKPTLQIDTEFVEKITASRHPDCAAKECGEDAALPKTLIKSPRSTQKIIDEIIQKDEARQLDKIAGKGVHTTKDVPKPQKPPEQIKAEMRQKVHAAAKLAKTEIQVVRKVSGSPVQVWACMSQEHVEKVEKVEATEPTLSEHTESSIAAVPIVTPSDSSQSSTPPSGNSLCLCEMAVQESRKVLKEMGSEADTVAELIAMLRTSMAECPCENYIGPRYETSFHLRLLYRAKSEMLRAKKNINQLKQWEDAPLCLESALGQYVWIVKRWKKIHITFVPDEWIRGYLKNEMQVSDGGSITEEVEKEECIAARSETIDGD